MWLYLVLGWFIVFGGFGLYVAIEKGRSELEGMVFGILLGPIGLLIVACLPVDRRSSSFALPKPAKLPDPLPDLDPPEQFDPAPDLQRFARLR